MGKRWQDALVEKKVKGKISESDFQIICASWLDRRGLVWCHPANEQKDVTAVGKLKKHGLKSGVPDILIFTPPPNFKDCRGVALELKIKPNKLSSNQNLWLGDLDRFGWYTNVCFSWKDFQADMKRLGW